ncbi:glycosyl hydrolase [Pseudorhodobacter sp.]|uniref:GH39 family glycosyl hydrolase n=1 Tax=Pseudorhodobacter sp. TaxID=1934400 RepID=UPI00264A18DD|nr:glycosyl hydrolase [Pseudorhodobacter sp.]MDN5786334.1 glycosyl hydrolase [Pseudorhodobacter sp.]
MSATFTCDLTAPSQPFPHTWEHCVGSGHALLALRADWQRDLVRCHADLGFRNVRFHGLLSDDVGTLTDQNDQLLYSFHNADAIFDFLLSKGMKPFVELSFMPLALSSGGDIVFHYKANITPPRDYGQWAELIGRLVRHWTERYGAKEVRSWHFEVWNEPNLSAFWTGTQADYFQLYRVTREAIKAVDASLQVGGPATSSNSWIDDFLKFCADNDAAPDFVSTHHYPTDDFGKPGDDTEAQLAASHLGVLAEQSAAVRAKIGDLPLFYTEWSTSSNPRDTLHDDPYAAAYIVRAVMEQQGIVDAYSYWTFSDIFEENYFPSAPFHGGFGLMNIHGIPKPAYRGYEILHDLGDRIHAVTGTHETVKAWVVSGRNRVSVLLVNLALPRHAISTEKVTLHLTGANGPSKARIRRIDADHANAKAHWQAMGAPDYPTPSDVAELQKASQLVWQPQKVDPKGGQVTMDITVQPQSVTLIELDGEGG